MKTAALVVALLVTGTTGTHAVREPPLVEGKSPEQFVRSEIEKAARLEFDTLMEQLFAHERGSDEQRKVAIARIKLAMYNTHESVFLFTKLSGKSAYFLCPAAQR